jgi:hypothetical protein
VKIFAREAAGGRADSGGRPIGSAPAIDINLADAIPVFHRWIQDRVRDELLIDVADYRHVHHGPGVLLVAHEANYSLDQADGRLGLLYARKSGVEGDTQAKLRQAFGAALSACRTLEQEEPFRGKLRFDAGECEVAVNDRLLAPNTDETWAALKPELERFFGTIYGAGGFALERHGEPRDLFRVRVKASAPVELAAAEAALGQ